MSVVKLSQHVDLLRLARANTSLAGYVPLEQLARLKDLVASESGQVGVQVEFQHDLQRRLIAKGSLAAEVTVVCQRCLQAMPLVLTSAFCLCVIDNDKQAVDLPDSYEPWIVPEQKSADLYAMVEEELLLSLPTIPMHADQECRGMLKEMINI